MRYVILKRETIFCFWFQKVSKIFFKRILVDTISRFMSEKRMKPLPKRPVMEKKKKKKPPLPAPRRKKRSENKMNGDEKQRRLSELGRQSLQDLLSGESLRKSDNKSSMKKSMKSIPEVLTNTKEPRTQTLTSSPPALPFRPLPPLPENRDHEIIRIKSVTPMNSRNLPSRPKRPPAAKTLNDALEGVRRYRQSGRIPTMRVYDSDDDEEDEPPTPLTRSEGAGRDEDPDPILKMTAKLCRNDVHVTYLQVKTKLLQAFGREKFQEKKKEVVRLLRWRKEMVEYDTQSQEDRDVALDAVWGSGTSLIDPVIDPDESTGGVEVEGLHTNAPLSHSFNYLQRQVLGHPFVLIRVIRARGLMSKGARSVLKASNPTCT